MRSSSGSVGVANTGQETKEHAPPPLTDDVGAARRTAAVECAWCGRPITPARRGPIPKWCSATCRHRAWEQTRAAASGRSAIQVVERRVDVPSRLPITRRDWQWVLGDLTAQLADGHIYDRDLADLATAIDAVLQAYVRRAGTPARADNRRPWR